MFFFVVVYPLFFSALCFLCSRTTVAWLQGCLLIHILLWVTEPILSSCLQLFLHFFLTFFLYLCLLRQKAAGAVCVCDSADRHVINVDSDGLVSSSVWHSTIQSFSQNSCFWKNKSMQIEEIGAANKQHLCSFGFFHSLRSFKLFFLIFYKILGGQASDK